MVYVRIYVHARTVERGRCWGRRSRPLRPVSERRGNNLKHCKDVCLKAKARIYVHTRTGTSGRERERSGAPRVRSVLFPSEEGVFILGGVGGSRRDCKTNHGSLSRFRAKQGWRVSPFNPVSERESARESKRRRESERARARERDRAERATRERERR